MVLSNKYQFKLQKVDHYLVLFVGTGKMYSVMLHKYSPSGKFSHGHTLPSFPRLLSAMLIHKPHENAKDGQNWVNKLF